MCKEIDLKEGSDYTLTGLMNYLNKTYKHKTFSDKKSKKKFILADIQQYAERGYLPDKYGGQKIEIIKSDKIGIKILRLKNKEK